MCRFAYPVMHASVRTALCFMLSSLYPCMKQTADVQNINYYINFQVTVILYLLIQNRHKNYVGWPFVLSNCLLIVHFDFDHQSLKNSRSIFEQGDFYLRLTYARIRKFSSSLSNLGSSVHCTYSNNNNYSSLGNLALLDDRPAPPVLKLYVYDSRSSRFFHYKLDCSRRKSTTKKNSIVNLLNFLFRSSAVENIKENLPERRQDGLLTFRWPNLNRCLCMNSRGQLVLVPVESMAESFCSSNNSFSMDQDDFIYIDSAGDFTVDDDNDAFPSKSNHNRRQQQQQNINNSEVVIVEEKSNFSSSGLAPLNSAEDLRNNYANLLNDRKLPIEDKSRRAVNGKILDDQRDNKFCNGLLNRRLWPKKIDPVLEAIMASGIFVYTGPVVLPTSTKSKSVLLVEVYPKKLLNLRNPVCPTNGRKFFSSPFGFTRTLIYLNHVHKSSSLSSVSSKPVAPKSIENWADCDRPSNRNLIGAATSATADSFSTVAGPKFNYNCRPSIVNGGKKDYNVKPQPRQQLIDEIIETRHVNDLVQCSTTTTTFDCIVQNEYDAAKNETIFILVDCRFDLKHFTGALHLFNILLEDLRLFEEVNGLRCKVNFVLLGADENTLKMFEESDIRNTENVDIDQLHAKIAPGQFSDHVTGGERKYNAVQWVNFRKDLEKFVNCCQTAAKFYIKSMKRLKVLVDENSVRILWSMPTKELENRALCIKNELELDKNSITSLNEFAITGQSQLCNLASHNADLESLPHYKEAILKVSTFFDEVCRLLNKYDKESVKLTQLFPQIIQVKERYEEFNELIDYFENDAQQILQYLNIRPNSAKDARSLLDELLRTENTIFEPILTRFEKFVDKDNFPGGDAADRTSYKEILRKAKMVDFSVLEGKLRNLVENFKLQKDLIKNSIQICEICYQLCDEAYEWALDCLKFASSLKKSLFNLPKMENSIDLLDNETCRKTLATLGEKLAQHLAISPKNKNLKLEKMKEIADELQDERLILQCQAVEVRCFETEEMLLEQKIHLERILENLDATKNEDSAQVKDRPLISSRSADQSFANIRRRSYAGSHSTSSLREVARSCVSRMPLHRRSLDCLIEENEGDPNSSQKSASHEPSPLLDQGPLCSMINQRFDLIDKLKNFSIVQYADDKLGQPTENHASVLNESASIDSVDRACQMSEYLDPTTRIASSSSSYINRLNNLMPCSFVDRRSKNDQAMVRLSTSLNSNARQRHVSLETLGSIEDVKSCRSDSLSSKEPFQKFLALKSIEANSAARSSQESSAKLEDSSFSSLSSSPPPFPAPEPPVGLGCSQTPTEDLRPETPPADASPTLRMQYNVVNELLQTERAYVRSLQYVVQNYIPEMQRPDLPQHLTGKRSIIFGNLEKLYEFHVNEFFPDLIHYCLKSTENLGAQVARCFLRHRSKFHLYALYSKNKPKSDALMVEYGSAVFKHKQMFLNDKMDLSSYLLKPVQRIGKYTLMMQNLLKANPPADQEQIDTLKQVEEMLIFQLRHGNDLLAMDSIQNCDISLKEQGQLLRQDEFVVYEGRSGKKCIRRIFLFQNLVLFTKPRRQRRSNGHHSSLHCSDVYEYKYSIMMTDVGLTERVSKDSELKFEIWFRRRTSDAIFLILSPSGAVKKAWVDDLSRLLWQQAFKNREDRLTEMSSMGIGTKLCRDLTHSEDRIQDRAVDSGLLIKSSRSKTILPNTFDVNSKFNLTSSKRPQSLISVDSSNSSSNSSAMTNNGQNSTSLFSTTTPMSSESGFADLVTLEEYSDTLEECSKRRNV